MSAERRLIPSDQANIVPVEPSDSLIGGVCRRANYALVSSEVVPMLQTGPPPRPVLRQRTRRFLRYAAEGVPLDQAAEQAGLTAARALRIVSELGVEGLSALLPQADEEAA